jgi:hypothetical protein
MPKRERNATQNRFCTGKAVVGQFESPPLLDGRYLHQSMSHDPLMAITIGMAITMAIIILWSSLHISIIPLVARGAL